jgi:hypothetical protein
MPPSQVPVTPPSVPQHADELPSRHVGGEAVLPGLASEQLLRLDAIGTRIRHPPEGNDNRGCIQADLAGTHDAAPRWTGGGLPALALANTSLVQVH